MGERSRAWGILHGVEANEKAAQTCREALEVYTRMSSSLDWARARGNLGGAILEMGGGRRQGDEGFIEEAAQACREAPKPIDREGSSLVPAAGP